MHIISRFYWSPFSLAFLLSCFLSITVLYATHSLLRLYINRSTKMTIYTPVVEPSAINVFIRSVNESDLDNAWALATRDFCPDQSPLGKSRMIFFMDWVLCSNTDREWEKRRAAFATQVIETASTPCINDVWCRIKKLSSSFLAPICGLLELV